MKRRCILNLAFLCIVASTPALAETFDVDELMDELVPAVLTNIDVTVVAEVTGLDEAQLREAHRELLAEFNLLTNAIAPPVLELPASRPEPLTPSDWPVGADVYVRQLKPIFVEEGVPASLVWLAEVESGFEPWARSRAGAAGLFQLMPATAELLGLSLKPVDDRFIPAKSARAAARYLKYLHDKFGDWPLTLAAYNAGEGRVRRLLDRYRARRFEQIALYLPPETRVYVPKVEATLLRREGVGLGDLP